MTLFDQVGEEKLRTVVREFYDRVFADVMIGYMFKGKDKERLIEKELELLMVTLGAPVRYTGRNMSSAHLGLRIMRGMFDRRLQIMKEVMEAHGLPDPVRERIIEKSESMRALIVNDGKECAERAPAASEEGTQE